jgi:SAM-dependent methyltransferase
MSLPPREQEAIIERYSRRFAEYGYSSKTLGWDKGKQDLRFSILTSQYDFRNKQILDIGCGFGDLNHTLRTCYGDEYTYHGVDLVPALIEKARDLYGSKNVKFSCADILGETVTGEYDYAISSGIFNHKMLDVANYDFIESVIAKALALCRDGLAVDFLSDKVDWRHAHTFHASPEKVLAIAFKFSRNVILRNDYMPFEFSLFINKDDSFSKDDTVFNLYKTRQLGGTTPPVAQTKRTGEL